MTEGNATLRTATIDDLDTLVELWWESSHYHEELEPRFQYGSGARKATREFFAKQMESENSCYWVAQNEDGIIGYVEAMVIERPPIHAMRRIGYLGSIYVKPEARQKGFGTKLWKLARDWFEEKEVSIIDLMVASKNPAAIEFWKKFNFSEIMIRLEVDISEFNLAD